MIALYSKDSPGTRNMFGAQIMASAQNSLEEWLIPDLGQKIHKKSLKSSKISNTRVVMSKNTDGHGGGPPSVLR